MDRAPLLRALIRDAAYVPVPKPGSYEVSYPEFLEYFRAVPLLKKHHLIIAANFSYGWMPTILDFRSEGYDDAVGYLERARRAADLKSHELFALSRLVNNSMVGASKLLHFVSATNYAIWDARVFDVVIACAFNYDAHATELNKLGRINILKARMNADLHMSEDLKNTGKGNLFVIFGEPDISLLTEKNDRVRVKVNGVDVFHPATGEVRSDGPDGIACWFIDTDYNGESFFVRQAYFLGANDPYGALKTTLKAEINEEAWASLNSDTSRAFDKPSSGRIAVKVINHLGDEVMKVFRVA